MIVLQEWKVFRINFCQLDILVCVLSKINWMNYNNLWDYQNIDYHFGYLRNMNSARIFKTSITFNFATITHLAEGILLQIKKWIVKRYLTCRLFWLEMQLDNNISFRYIRDSSYHLCEVGHELMPRKNRWYAEKEQPNARNFRKKRVEFENS